MVQELGQEKGYAPVGGEAEDPLGAIAVPGAIAEGDTLPIWDWGICMGHVSVSSAF